MLEIETEPVVEDDEEDVEDEAEEDEDEFVDGDLDCDGMSIFVSNTGTVEVVVASMSMPRNSCVQYQYYQDVVVVTRKS